MLFLFDKPDYYPFWMKGMKFPLDILFIRGSTIVSIRRDFATWSHARAPARRCLGGGESGGSIEIPRSLSIPAAVAFPALPSPANAPLPVDVRANQLRFGNTAKVGDTLLTLEDVRQVINTGTDNHLLLP